MGNSTSTEAGALGQQPGKVPADEEKPLDSCASTAARTWISFVSQRISVAAQLAMAQEAAEALGLSVAADPRGQ